MRYLYLILILFFPAFTLAACTQEGVSVVYVNGIFTSKEQAKDDLKNLRTNFVKITGNKEINFLNGYNESHLAGVGDLVQSIAQILGSSVSDYDLDTILLQIHPEVTTRRLLLVGHSQGTFYTNAMYGYLLAHGEPREAVGVYNIASPAPVVAGGGKYLNSQNDALLDFVEKGSGIPVLARNINIPIAEEDKASKWPGHGVSRAYLAGAAGRVVADMQEGLGKLEPAFASGTGECFTAPDASLGYKAQGVLFAIGDPVAGGAKVVGSAAATAAVAAANTLAGAVAGAFSLAQKVAADIGVAVGGAGALSHAAEPHYNDINFEIAKRLYGSSLTKQDYDELTGKTQGGAVASAPIFNEPAKSLEATPLGPAVPIGPAPGVSPGGGGSAPVAENISDPTTQNTISTSATSTGPDTQATSTSPAATSTPLLSGSPVTDSFDSYDGSGWTPFGGGAPVTLYATTTPECHSGGCIETGTQFPAFGAGTRMYRTGAPKEEGSLTIWIKHHTGFQGVSGVFVLVCIGAPLMPSPTNCGGLINFETSEQDVWHEYYLAWRNNGADKELCKMIDDTDAAHCAWAPYANFAPGDAPDTVALTAGGVRPDLGDILWFDDLDN